MQPNAQFFLIKLQFILVFSHTAAIDLWAHVYEEPPLPPRWNILFINDAPFLLVGKSAAASKKLSPSFISSSNKGFSLIGFEKNASSAVNLGTPGEP